MSRLQNTDVLVVGGGPAGLAAAIAAASLGLSVTVADSARPPIDKACGEGLMPDSRLALAALGIDAAAELGFEFHGVRFLGDRHSTASDFPNGPGLGLRRPILHSLMIERADSLGVRLLWNTPVRALTSSGAWLSSGEIHCRWIVGADGENSRVRRWAGLDHNARSSRRFGFRKHFHIAPWTRFMEVYWGPNCQMYVTPVASEQVCVALISRDPHLRMDRALRFFPALAARLNRHHTSAERGAVSATRRLARPASGRVALIGDASGSVDAITGEGMCLAFRQALALASALRSGSLESYNRAHRSLMRRPAAMAALLLSLDSFPTLRRRTLAALERRPSVFSTLLAAHVGAASPLQFALDGILPLGWNLIASR